MRSFRGKQERKAKSRRGDQKMSDIKTIKVLDGGRCGMTSASLHMMKEALELSEKKVVYVGFELPRITKETMKKEKE